jgi:hypothetical protein
VHCTTSITRFEQFLSPLSKAVDLEKLALTHNTDARCRKFSTLQHLKLSLFAHLDKENCPSTRAIIEQINDPNDPKRLRHLLGFPATNEYELKPNEPFSLNQSSLSRANSERNYRVWQHCFHRLHRLARAHFDPNQLDGLLSFALSPSSQSQSELGRVVAVDGSLFDCLPRMVWALYRSHSFKCKVHFFYNLDTLPERIVLTAGKASERAVLDEWLVPYTTYLIDRGYNSYELFAHIKANRSHFVTRLLSAATYQMVSEAKVSPADFELGLRSDETIRLTVKVSPKEQLFRKMLSSARDSQAIKEANPADEYELELRLVTFAAMDGRTYRYLTSRFDLCAMDIVRLYLLRWEIERFIAWIKRYLSFEHWYSHDLNGVLIQLYAGLICYLLFKLAVLGKFSAELVSLNLTNLRHFKRHLLDKVSQSQLEAYLARFTFPPSS